MCAATLLFPSCRSWSLRSSGSLPHMAVWPPVTHSPDSFLREQAISHVWLCDHCRPSATRSCPQRPWRAESLRATVLWAGPVHMQACSHCHSLLCSRPLSSLFHVREVLELVEDLISPCGAITTSTVL